jgi:urease accessory protein
MIRLARRLVRPAHTNASVTLTLDQRLENRLRVRLDDGREAGIFLERADSLERGDFACSTLQLTIVSGVASSWSDDPGLVHDVSFREPP